MRTIKDWRGLGAETGVSLSTTAAYTTLIPGTHVLSLTARNFSTAVVALVTFCPWGVVLKTTDDLATKGNLTDYSDEAQDGDAGTDVVLSSLDTLANDEYVLIGAPSPFRGLDVDVDAANGTTSTLAVHYWNGTAWADISPTDGTASGGATFAQDGQITWTVPSAWDVATLNATGGTLKNVGIAETELFWVRLSVSAALDSSTTLNQLLLLNQSTSEIALDADRTMEQEVYRGLGGVSAIEALTDAGTANLIVRAGTYGRFP